MFLQSPNFTKGRGGKNIEFIIIHWFGVGSIDSAESSFMNPDRQASAHYLISDDRLDQMVSEEDTAWHCGNLDINKRSIGIEHDAGIDPQHDLSEKSYQTSGKLVREICGRYGIPLDREHIKGHNEIKATQCPGTINIDKIIEIAKGENMAGFSEKQIKDTTRETLRSGRMKAFGHVDLVGLEADVEDVFPHIQNGELDPIGKKIAVYFDSKEFDEIWIKRKDCKPIITRTVEVPVEVTKPCPPCDQTTVVKYCLIDWDKIVAWWENRKQNKLTS